jgi:signal transduction histidine kinase
VRPLDRLRLAALNLGEGNLNARAPVNGGAEIADVGMAFNRMAEQIKDREDRLTELDRLKSEFVGSVSHELRTPLTTIKTLTHVLQRTDPSDTERREYLATISSECDRQIRLVTNLLDLARIESGAHQLDLTPVNVSDVITASARVERHAAELRGQRLIVLLPEEEVSVITNHSALERVLCALIENAIKYTPDSGEIAVGAEALDGEVGIYVRDTGRGIRTADVPHIFERFYRAANDGDGSESRSVSLETGVGLGLYLVKSLVNQLDGRITVETKVNEGSTFTVFLARSHAGDTGKEGVRTNDVGTVTGS